MLSAINKFWPVRGGLVRVGGKHGGRDRYVEIGVLGGEGVGRSVWTGSAVIYTGDELRAFRIFMPKSPFLRESSAGAWPYVEVMVGHGSSSKNRLVLHSHHARPTARSELHDFSWKVNWTLGNVLFAQKFLRGS